MSNSELPIPSIAFRLALRSGRAIGKSRSDESRSFFRMPSIVWAKAKQSSASATRVKRRKRFALGPSASREFRTCAHIFSAIGLDLCMANRPRMNTV